MITIFFDFCQFSVKKLAFFSKSNVMIKNLPYLALFLVKNANFWNFFGENIFKIITSVLGWYKLHILLLFEVFWLRFRCLCCCCFVTWRHACVVWISTCPLYLPISVNCDAKAIFIPSFNAYNHGVDLTTCFRKEAESVLIIVKSN
jgi:hypothetical protein